MYKLSHTTCIPFAFLWVLQSTTCFLQVQSCMMLLPPATRLFCQMKLSYHFTRPIRGKLHKTTFLNLWCHLTLLGSWQNHNGPKDEDLASDLEFVWYNTSKKMLRLLYLKIAPLIFANRDYTAGLQMYVCHNLIGEQEHVGTTTALFWVERFSYIRQHHAFHLDIMENQHCLCGTFSVCVNHPISLKYFSYHSCEPEFGQLYLQQIKIIGKSLFRTERRFSPHSF